MFLNFKIFYMEKKRSIFLVGIVLAIAAGIAAALIISINKTNKRPSYKIERAAFKNPTKELPSESSLGVYAKGAISTDGAPCAQIGVDILKRNGSAIDAAIASSFCLGVVNSASTGIGGGFFLTYYERSSGRSYTLDAREVAPAAASEDMFVEDASLSRYGGLAVAVPGATKGYWEAYQRFGGGVPWADLIEPTIKLCEKGLPLNYHTANALKEKEEYILKEPSMSLFLNPATGKLFQEGEIMYRKDLASTLRTLQTEPDALHTGSLLGTFQEDLAALGSIITKEDLMNYTAEWKDPINVQLSKGDYTIHSFPPPGSGVIYTFIMNVLDNYHFTPESLNDTEIVTTYQRIVEAFKYAYAERTKLGDPHYVDMKELLANVTSEAFAYDIYSKITDNITFQDPQHYGMDSNVDESHGTSHLSVVAPNGDAVALTGTINLYFGAIVRSIRTGIILNDEMDDFSTPNQTNAFGLSPSPSNFIRPGKRPVSSMCPTVLVDRKGDVRLVVGAAGGSRITSSSALVTMHNRWFGKNIKEAVDSKRVHHQLMPMVLEYQEGIRQDIIRKLEAIGHQTKKYSGFLSVVCAISREKDGKLNANSDYRKKGEVDGF